MQYTGLFNLTVQDSDAIVNTHTYTGLDRQQGQLIIFPLRNLIWILDVRLIADDKC